MTRSEQIQIRPFPLVRLNTWLWRGCLSCLPKAWLSYITSTRQFRHRYQKKVAQEARKGLRLFRDLQALDTTTKRSLFFQMRNHENRQAIMFISQGYVALVGFLALLIGVYIVAMLPNIKSSMSLYSSIPFLLSGWVGRPSQLMP